jgi:hypothetical protein
MLSGEERRASEQRESEQWSGQRLLASVEYSPDRDGRKIQPATGLAAAQWLEEWKRKETATDVMCRGEWQPE